MFILGVTIFIIPQDGLSIFERRSLKKNEDIRIENISADLNGVMNDQFPFRKESLKYLFGVRQIFNKPFGSKLLKVKEDVIHLENGYYIDDFYKITENEKQLALGRAFNIQEISKKYLDIKVYVYFPTKIEETNLLHTDKIDTPYAELKEEFIAQLGDKVKTASLKLNSIDDYYKYFYKADIHWNGFGTYEGYKDIINMIAKDFDIENPKKAKITTYPYPFYGGYAVRMAFMTEPENLIDMEIETDAYSHYVNGKEFNDQSSLERYKEKGNENPIYSDYEYAYGSVVYERIYDFNKPEKPNLLVFADSYIFPLKRALASHFNKTIIVDLRANDGSFNIEEYIRKYDIDAILFLQFYEDLFFNGDFYVPLNN